ncbi:flagellar hook-length control protein FliK [Desulforamulus putei]|uniref:Hook-length control protein FliK n=1 Tax=Desulforamulus putei DSM 12395 TaxID=1121429 RepID=A0A1M4WF25_9FIRM|nr:flagellar hook-length control protein FliK [Desulforamulus putei]SHE79848.1 hook-length control protein FliK [Desulforamulus putei DSM 12395]
MIDKVMSALFKATDNMRVTPGKQVDKIQPKPFALAQNLAAETARESVKTSRPAGPARATEPVTVPDRQDQLTYVPLPWRTPLYEDAKFYWRLKDFSAQTGANGEARVIFSINTDTLGLLWFTLTTRPGKFLSVQCIAETQTVVEVFRAGAMDLQQELTELGYENVIVSCRMQSGIRSIADIDPAFASEETSVLLDVKI